MKHPDSVVYKAGMEAGRAEAAAEIACLRARVAELEAALEPFADEAAKWEDFDGSQPIAAVWSASFPDCTLTTAHLRRARAAIRGEEG